MLSWRTLNLFQVERAFAKKRFQNFRHIGVPRQRNGDHVGDPNQSFVPIKYHHAAGHVSGKVVYRIANICRAFGNAPGNELDVTLLGRNSQLLFGKDGEQFEFIRLQLLGGIWRRCIGVTLQV